MKRTFTSQRKFLKFYYHCRIVVIKVVLMLLYPNNLLCNFKLQAFRILDMLLLIFNQKIIIRKSNVRLLINGMCYVIFNGISLTVGVYSCLIQIANKNIWRKCCTHFDLPNIIFPPTVKSVFSFHTQQFRQKNANKIPALPEKG